MTVEVCLSNKRRKVIPSSNVVVLPDEIMTEVFLRLPIKSILRFRAVCRSWAALLSSEEFCSLHMAATEVASTPPKLLFVSPTANFNCTAVYSCSLLGRVDDLLFTLEDARGNFVDVSPAPCRGLTLLYDGVVPAYYVCNAATRAVTRLPPCYGVPYATAGLGFDAQTKKYKVVRFFQGRGHEKQSFYCEVYTLGGEDGDHWRPVSGGVPFRFCSFARSAIWYAVFRKMQPVFMDGFLHWLIEPAFFTKMPRAAIISFSLTNETFSWIRSPPFVVSGAHLVELDGHLCMVRDLRSGFPAGSMLEIWKLKDYSSGDWSLNHRIHLLGHVPARDFLEPQVVKVIGSFGNSKSSNRILIGTSKHKVFAYDPMSETLETIHSTMGIQTSCQFEPSDTRFSLFRESLAPVHKTKEEIALSSPLAKATKEILLRLPAESALNFKLVCKLWLRLIKRESFAHSFFLRKNMDKRPKIMLVGKGTGQPGFSFIPLNKWLQETSNEGEFLDTKVVCSKPCHGLNLVSIKKKDYLYNPSTGFHRIYLNKRAHMHQLWKLPIDSVQTEDHPFSVGNKNVGLGFNPLIQEHVTVEMFYPLKDYKSRQYYLTCSLWSCNSGHVQQLPPPPLPVSDMPPAYLEGMLYWMSEPRLGQSHKRAIVSFNNATKIFDVIPCPSCIAIWNSSSPCHAYVVELEGVLCAVLANPDVDELDIWKWELGQWYRAYTIYLKSWPDYSLGTNIVVPLAIDPTDGRVLLNTGRKLGLYNPLKQAIENSLALDQTPLFARKEQTSCLGVHPELHITKRKHVDRKSSQWKPSMDRYESFAQPSSASLGKNLSHSRDQSKEEINRMSKLMPLVPMIYEESLAYYPGAAKGRVLK
ncbi:uncharacterized protein LOC133883842 [Phragmites australis]|uniref:uncharacterized protein LOC133883842 n=1 Tax=Phragmites australis TaxID=29695 RepID=UPI002D779F81|nr:uncharacterized protein LOC133883842 [Phragmites australis]